MVVVLVGTPLPEPCIVTVNVPVDAELEADMVKLDVNAGGPLAGLKWPVRPDAPAQSAIDKVTVPHVPEVRLTAMVVEAELPC